MSLDFHTYTKHWNLVNVILHIGYNVPDGIFDFSNDFDKDHQRNFSENVCITH